MGFLLKHFQEKRVISMKYPKQIMRLSELRKMGFPETYLLNAYFDRNQNFAWKMDVRKSNSPILFETEKFEEYRQKQMSIDRQINRHSEVVV